MGLEPLVRQLKIRTKGSGLDALRPNWAQRQFLEVVERQRAQGRGVRIIVCKARQLGISTITEACMFINAWMNKHSFGLVVAHDADGTEHIFDMTRTYWEHAPWRDLYTPKYHSKRELAWVESGSAIRVRIASGRGAGRARTINFLHASEVAFWQDPRETMLALRNTVPDVPSSWIVVESTARGIGGWFHETWVEAEDGRSEYEPLFLPWWRHPEYTASFTGIAPLPLGRLEEEERWLRKSFRVSRDHLMWRRWAIQNKASGDLDKFHQEYPSTPEEAFLTTGRPAFNHERLRDCYRPLAGLQGRLELDQYGRPRFLLDPTGKLRVFRKPSSDRSWGTYFVGGDPAHLGGHDFAGIQVINRRTFEQVAVWRGKIDPVNFGDELVRLARFYNDAEISTEVTGPGYATIGRLMSLNYPHIWQHRWADRLPGKVTQMFGWATTEKFKEWLVGELAKLILDRSLQIHDAVTYGEMRTYVSLDGGGYGPADEEQGFDDLVMSLGIAVVCSRTEAAPSPYEAPEVHDRIEPIVGAEEVDAEPAWAGWGR